MSGEFSDKQTRLREQLDPAIEAILDYDLCDCGADAVVDLEALRDAYRESKSLCIHCGEPQALQQAPEVSKSKGICTTHGEPACGACRDRHGYCAIHGSPGCKGCNSQDAPKVLYEARVCPVHGSPTCGGCKNPNNMCQQHGHSNCPSCLDRRPAS